MSTSSRFAVAVHILTLLAQSEGPVPSSMIAGSVGTNPALIRRMIGTLTEAGFVTTAMGSTGGAMLARAPDEISIGDIVRMAEKDFAVVACHDTSVAHGCRIFAACNLKRGLARAVDAFMAELDAMTLQDAITVPTVAAGLLGLTPREQPIKIARSPRRRVAG